MLTNFIVIAKITKFQDNRVVNFCLEDSPAPLELGIKPPWNDGGRRVWRGAPLRGQARTGKKLTFAEAIGDLAKVDLIKKRLRITIHKGLKVDFRDVIQ